MGDIADIGCAFCGSIIGLGHEVVASAEAHALRFFSCEICGARELRIGRDEESGIRRQGSDHE
jgi:hypothetical protein